MNWGPLSKGSPVSQSFVVSKVDTSIFLIAIMSLIFIHCHSGCCVKIRGGPSCCNFGLHSMFGQCIRILNYVVDIGVRVRVLNLLTLPANI